MRYDDQLKQLSDGRKVSQAHYESVVHKANHRVGLPSRDYSQQEAKVFFNGYKLNPAFLPCDEY